MGIVVIPLGYISFDPSPYLFWLRGSKTNEKTPPGRNLRLDFFV